MAQCPRCKLETSGSPVCIHCGESLPGPLPASSLPPPPQFASFTAFERDNAFTAGSILGQTFSITFTNLAPFLAICALFELPQVLGSFFLLREQPDFRLAAAGGCSLIVVGFVLSALMTGALTYGVLQTLRRRPTPFGECLRFGFSSLGRVLWISIKQGMIVAVASLFCLIPGIVASVMLAVAVPAAVEEKPGASGALQRSYELTDGYRWPIFFVQIVIGILMVGVSYLSPKTTGSPETWPSTEVIVRLVAVRVLQALTSSLLATAAAVTYYRLREVKEAVGVTDMVSVFD